MRLIDGDALLRKLKTAKEGSMVAVKHIQEHEVYTAESIALTTFSIVEDVINKVPTIDPMKHGMWVIKEHDKDFPENFARCSICGFPVGRWWGQDNYCPNCGARMDADE